jgi:hypothetical protein
MWKLPDWDFDQFRQDKALALLLVDVPLAKQTARNVLMQFHGEESPLLQERKPRPAESVRLGLSKRNAELVLGLRCCRPLKPATFSFEIKGRPNGPMTAPVATRPCWRCGPNRA